MQIEGIKKQVDTILKIVDKAAKKNENKDAICRVAARKITLSDKQMEIEIYLRVWYDETKKLHKFDVFNRWLLKNYIREKILSEFGLSSLIV